MLCAGLHPPPQTFVYTLLQFQIPRNGRKEKAAMLITERGCLSQSVPYRHRESVLLQLCQEDTRLWICTSLNIGLVTCIRNFELLLILYCTYTIIYITLSGGSSYRRGGASFPPRPLPKMWHPLGGNFKRYTNHCHLDPVNICFTNMHN